MCCFYRHFMVFSLPKASHLKTNIYTDFKLHIPFLKLTEMGILMPSILNAYRAGVLFHLFFLNDAPPHVVTGFFPAFCPPGTGSDKVQQH